MNDSKDHKAAAEPPLDCWVGRDIVDRLRETDRRLVAAGHETYIGDAANEIENLRAMYDAQCRCTDEWAEKYRAEVERKGDEALLRRVKELEDALAAVNSRLAAPRNQKGVMNLENTQNENSAAGGLSDLTDVLGFPPVLDVCCGPRMMWFDKDDDRALFHDRRDVDISTKPNAAYKNGKVFSIRPDVCGSFAELQFPDNTFSHVVFDPPHFVETDPNSKMLMRVQYGQLADGWKDEIRDGFAECFRVLKPQGTLVFKWCEYDVPVSEVLALTPEKPLYGHRSGKQSKTHWLVFMKPNA